jgi:hypothetical protein
LSNENTWAVIQNIKYFKFGHINYHIICIEDRNDLPCFNNSQSNFKFEYLSQFKTELKIFRVQYVFAMMPFSRINACTQRGLMVYFKPRDKNGVSYPHTYS